MGVLRYVLPALAAAGYATAQCSVTATTTIQSQADASGLAQCSTFTGSIALATGSSQQNYQLDGIQRIMGSLVAENNNMLIELEAANLATIDDSFTLSNLTLLSTLNFPSLTTVNSIDWISIPNLDGLAFGAGVSSAKSVSIQNTHLQQLTGIDLMEVDTLYIANNPLLKSIDMQLSYVTNGAIIQANGMNLTLSFPDLIWAYNLTVSNASSIDIPALSSTNGTLGFHSCYFDSIVANNLTSVGGTLSFTSNNQLTNVSMPELKSINGGFQAINNTEFTEVNGFSSLATVGGAVEFNGAFESVVFPALSNVKGAFTLLSSSSKISSSCATFSKEAGMTAVIKGTLDCPQAASNTTTSGSGSGTSSGTSSTPSSSKSAGNPLFISGATGVLGVVAAIFGML